MNETQHYKDLLGWQNGIELAKKICGLTGRFPTEEKFGLVSRMRRAAIPIPSNLAEGRAGHTTGEFMQFISHAEGSAAELETQLILPVELDFQPKKRSVTLYEAIEELRRMLNALLRKLVARKT